MNALVLHLFLHLCLAKPRRPKLSGPMANDAIAWVREVWYLWCISVGRTYIRGYIHKTLLDWVAAKSP